MLRAVYAQIVFVLATLVLGGLAFVGSLLRPGSDICMRMGRAWSRAMLSAMGARVTYEGVEHSRAVRPCVYIANHQSNVDIWVLIRVLPLHTRFVAKQSLFRIPVMGWAMAAAGFIPIDRRNRGRAIESLRLAATRIRQGRSVVLFPEGTRSKDGRLLPFKKGPFHLALEAGVPVVPVAIHGSGRVLPSRAIRPRPGPVLVRFLEPVPVAAYEPRNHAGLLEEVRRRIEEELGEAPAANPRNGAADSVS